MGCSRLVGEDKVRLEVSIPMVLVRVKSDLLMP